jgi:uncharacterized SAM-binding protein YcdF (DUF218 family)
MDASVALAQFVRVVLLPPAGLFLLALLGWLLRLRWRRTGNAVIAVAVVLVTALTTPIGARSVGAPLERRTTALVAPRDARAQAIVILAAGRVEHAPEYGDRDIPDYVALGRLRYGARLQHETGLPILVSGGEPLGRRPAEAELMAGALAEDFRTPVRWIEPRSRNTAENATMSADMLRQDGVRRVLLVTDAMHMPRAAAQFTRAGLDVIEAPTLFLSRGALVPRDFVPSAEGLRRSYYAAYEWVGLAWYSLRYR